MSLLPLKTHLTPTQALYVPYFSTATVNASTISTGTVTAAAGEFSSILVSSIDLDGQILTAAPGELLLNGVPLATLSSLSSIADWSYEPALSTVQMAGNDLDQGGTLSSLNVRAGNGFFTNLIAFNSLFVSTATSTISSFVDVADLGLFSTLSTGGLVAGTVDILSTISTPALFTSTINGVPVTAFENISSFSTLSVSSLGATVADISGITVSSINGKPITAYETLSTFSTASISSLTVNEINGVPYTTGSNWSQYPANSVINVNSNSMINVSTILAMSNIYMMSIDGSIDRNAYYYLRDMASYVSTGANGGVDITTPGYVRIGAMNGSRGEITLRADTGYLDNGGVVNIEAVGGVTPLGVAYGGEVNITATTGSYTSLAFTSAVNLNAAGINSYAGATSAVGSVAGYNFVHGDAGLNLTAGAPPLLPNDPLTVYLYGTNGVLVYSPMYIYGPIRPYSDLTNNPKDLYIEAYDNLITKGYIQLRGISTATFEGGDTAILGVNKIQFSSIGGEVTGLSSINGVPISSYQNISSISSLNEWALYPALSSVSFASGVPAVINSASDLNSITLDTTLGVVNGNLQLGSTLGGDVRLQAAIPGKLSIENSGGTAVRLECAGLNVNGVAGYTTIDYVSSINQLVYTSTTGSGPVKYYIPSLTDISESVVTNFLYGSTVSTAVIQGANNNLFGLGLPGLEIDAENVYISSLQTNVGGFLNTSTIGAKRFQGGEAQISSISTQELTANRINTSSITGGEASLLTIGAPLIYLSTGGPAPLVYTDGEMDALRFESQEVYTSTIQTSSINASTITMPLTVDGVIEVGTVKTSNISSTGLNFNFGTAGNLSFLANDINFVASTVRIGNNVGSESILYASTFSTIEAIADTAVVSSLTANSVSTIDFHASSINTYPIQPPPRSAFTNQVLWTNLSTTAEVIASTTFTVDTPSYVVANGTTTVKNTTNQYKTSFFYLEIDGSISPSTITTLINDAGSFSGQAITFRAAVSTGTYPCRAWAYASTDGDLQVIQTELNLITNLL